MLLFDCARSLNLILAFPLLRNILHRKITFIINSFIILNNFFRKKTVAVLDSEQELELLLKTENLERETLIEQLQKAIEKERGSVERLQELLAETIS